MPPQAPRADPRAAAPLPAAAERASIRATVVDHLGRGLLPAEVELRSGSQAARVLALDTDGGASFDVLPGEHRLLVRAESLAPGWLAPWGQEQASVLASDPLARPGFLARTVAIERADERPVIELCVWRAARARGRVLDAAGEPAEGVGVRLQSVAQEDLLVEARTDADGCYAFEDLYPGDYTLLARPAQARRPELRALPATRPLALAIAEGEDVLCAELRLRAGERELAGRVVDQDGRPLAGLEVRVQPIAPSDQMPHAGAFPALSSRTDADGRFLCADLPAERVLVRVEPGFDPAAPLLERRLAAAVEPFEVDLSGAEARLELAPVRARASRPFVARVALALDLDWARAHGLTPADLRARVAWAEGEPAERGLCSELRLDPAKSEILWCAETPHPAVLLIVACGEEERSLRLDPLPGEALERTLELP